MDQACRLALSGVVLDAPDAGTLADFCRSVYLNPAGHPFCLFLPG